MTVVWFFLMLLVLVLVHELGHFASAKLFKVKVEEFGFFLPPRIWGFKHKETIYSINWLPLGGFVRMSGEEDPKAEGSLASKSALVRFIVLGAGSVMNLLLPFVLLSIALMIPHLATADKGDVLVSSVQVGSPAQQAGIVAEDIVTDVADTQVTSDVDYSKIVKAHLGQAVTVGLKRDKARVQVTLTPRADSKPATGAIVSKAAPGGGVLVDSVQAATPAQLAGITEGDVVLSIDGVDINAADQYASTIDAKVADSIEVVVRHVNGKQQTVTLRPYLDPPATGVSISTVKTESMPFWKAIPASAGSYWDIIVLFRDGVLATVRGVVPFQVSGPVGIAQATGQVAKLGISPLLRFAAFVSINLGVVNILPLPALDGGRVFFVLLEWVRRGKRVSPETERRIHAIGFFLLLLLVALATWKDIARLISGQGLGP